MAVKAIRRISSAAGGAALLALCAFGSLSCGANSGLGPEVDLTAPVVTSGNLKDGDTVPVIFTLDGTASDNIEVTSLTIDVEPAGFHYRVTPGATWQKSTDGSVWADTDEGSCERTGSGAWRWSVEVDVDGIAASGDNYSVSIVAKDAIGNSSEKSKLDLSLIVDTEIPAITINSPELIRDSYAAAESTVGNYELHNGNYISRLLNGDITLSGRLAGSVSFKELMLEFDSGEFYDERGFDSKGDEYKSFVATSAAEVAAGVSLAGEDEGDIRTYHTVTLAAGEDGITSELLRNWEVTIPEEALTSNPELAGGKHIIRVVATSMSGSLAWQRRTLGFFCWWPEADIPWIDTYIGDEAEPEKAPIFPSSYLTGAVHDDDGIASVVYKIEKLGDDGEWAEHEGQREAAVSEYGATSSPLSVLTPPENGDYRITLTVTDINGKQNEPLIRYFRTLDVNPPKISFERPVSGGAVLDIASSDANGNITFEGTVSDDGEVAALVMIHLHPEYTDLPENIIRYMSGGEMMWDYVSAEVPRKEDGYTAPDGSVYANTIYYVPLVFKGYDDDKRANVYAFEKTLNIFSDLGIDGESRKLRSQYFIFRAVDKGSPPSNTVHQLTLSGDTKSPELTLDSISIYDGSGVDGIGVLQKKDNFTEGSIPNLPVIKDGYTAVLEGKCGDNSTDFWADASHIGEINIVWNGKSANAKVTRDLKVSRTWRAELENIPKQSGTIEVSLADLGGNKSTVTKAVSIETAVAGLERINSTNSDGSYSSVQNAVIEITLEFNKNVQLVSGSPTLTLNNGGTATYSGSGKTDSGAFTKGSESARHYFTYNVKGGGKSTTKDNTSDKLVVLNVTAINGNGAVWEDVAHTPVDVVKPDNSKNLAARKIVIDNDAPRVSTVRVLSTDTFYKKDSQILLMLEFNENVTMSGDALPQLVIGNNKSGKIEAAASGSRNIIYTYTVGAGDVNKALTFGELSGDKAAITDEAGNPLDDWEPLTKPDFTDKTIDTKAPASPEIKPVGWESGGVVTAAGGASFKIDKIEEYAEVEYATDGTNWKRYRYSDGDVTLSANGTYEIRARQTDRAGNTSVESVPVKVTVDRGELLTRITADTVSGKYSTSTNTKEITGRIEFRKEVTIPAGATVTLNVRNGGTTTKTAKIDNAGKAASSYTFKYAIADGDHTDGLLDVTGWNFNTVDVEGSDGKSSSVDMGFAGNVTESKRLSKNREIEIRAIAPVVKSIMSDTAGNIEITFDQNIENKGPGDIKFEQSDDDYRVPTVLSVSEFTALKGVMGEKEAEEYYEKGTNGADVDESSGKIASDTDTKYVLREYKKGTTSPLLTNKTTELRKAFRDKLEWHKLIVPVASSTVSVKGSTLIITGGVRKLPVKGASYKVEVPDGAIVDVFQNKNAEHSSVLTAGGVEKPEIRIMKDGYTITNAGTANANVTLPLTARVYMETQTPNAEVYYTIGHAKGSEVRVNKSPNTDFSNVKEADYSVTVPSSASTRYVRAISLGDGVLDGTDYTINESDGAAFNANNGSIAGAKFAIRAEAVIGGKRSEPAYEYATRTVLKFVISGNYGIANHGAEGVVKGGGKLKALKVWIIGGDYTHGGNSIDPFPLSWSDTSSFKLMRYVSPFDDNMYGKFYWVSWDLSANAYHGFVVGDVPADAATAGPSFWYAGSYGWAAVKDMYILHQGETMTMAVESGNGADYNGNNYRFDLNLLNER